MAEQEGIHNESDVTTHEGSVMNQFKRVNNEEDLLLFFSPPTKKSKKHGMSLSALPYIDEGEEYLTIEKSCFDNYHRGHDVNDQGVCQPNPPNNARQEILKESDVTTHERSVNQNEGVSNADLRELFCSPPEKTYEMSHSVLPYIAEGEESLPIAKSCLDNYHRGHDVNDQGVCQPNPPNNTHQEILNESDVTTHERSVNQHEGVSNVDLRELLCSPPEKTYEMSHSVLPYIAEGEKSLAIAKSFLENHTGDKGEDPGGSSKPAPPDNTREKILRSNRLKQTDRVNILLKEPSLIVGANSKKVYDVRNRFREDKNSSNHTNNGKTNTQPKKKKFITIEACERKIKRATLPLEKKFKELSKKIDSLKGLIKELTEAREVEKQKRSSSEVIKNEPKKMDKPRIKNTAASTSDFFDNFFNEMKEKFILDLSSALFANLLVKNNPNLNASNLSNTPNNASKPMQPPTTKKLDPEYVHLELGECLIIYNKNQNLSTNKTNLKQLMMSMAKQEDILNQSDMISNREKHEVFVDLEYINSGEAITSVRSWQEDPKKSKDLDKIFRKIFKSGPTKTFHVFKQKFSSYLSQSNLDYYVKLDSQDLEKTFKEVQKKKEPSISELIKNKPKQMEKPRIKNTTASTSDCGKLFNEGKEKLVDLLSASFANFLVKNNPNLYAHNLSNTPKSVQPPTTRKLDSEYFKLKLGKFFIDYNKKLKLSSVKSNLKKFMMSLAKQEDMITNREKSEVIDSGYEYSDEAITSVERWHEDPYKSKDLHKIIRKIIKSGPKTFHKFKQEFSRYMSQSNLDYYVKLDSEDLEKTFNNYLK